MPSRDEYSNFFVSAFLALYVLCHGERYKQDKSINGLKAKALDMDLPV